MRAVQETLAGLFVLAAFTHLLQESEPGTLRHYGCLVILIGTGFIVGVVWAYTLSYTLLRNHPAGDLSFWREAFGAQARLLRWAPLWYCTPICLGGILFAAPTSRWELVPFAMVAAMFLAVCVGIAWLNRCATAQLDASAALLTA